MTQMENRIVFTRFKDGYGPVGAYFLHLKTYTQNTYGEEYESKWYEHTKAMVGEYIDHTPTPTCLRNHASSKKLKLVEAQSIWLQWRLFKIHISRLLDGKTF